MNKTLTKLSLILIAVTAAQSTVAETLVGADGGAINISNAGQAAWSLKVVVPKGINGVEPNLQLTLGTGGSNGSLGVGAGLSGVSSISRCARNHEDDGYSQPVQYTIQDRLCLDGQRLELETGSWGQVGSTYRTKIESFVQVSLMGGDLSSPTSYFSLKNKNGTRTLYGQDLTRGTFETDPVTGVKTLWKVDELSDINTNYMQFMYKTFGEFPMQIKKISYGGNRNAGIAPNLSVRMRYVERPDKQTFWSRGWQQTQTHRIDAIRTAVGNDFVREYFINYELTPVSGLSRIQSIQACAANGDCYRPTTFTYADQDLPQWNSSSAAVPDVLQTSDGKPLGVLVDINNDGQTDWVTAHIDNTGTSTIRTFVAANGVWQTSSAFALPGPLFDYTRSDDGFSAGVLLDVNSDGWPDYVQSYKDTDGSVVSSAWRNTGNGFVSDPALVLPASLLALQSNGDAVALAEPTDLNGDSLLDVVQSVRFADATVSQVAWIKSLVNGVHTWTVSTDYTPPTVANDYTIEADGRIHSALQDINGDGLVDWVQASTENGAVSRSTWLNTGQGWSLANHYALPVSSFNYDVSSQGVSEYLFSDLNSDNLPDLVKAVYYAATDTAEYDTWINTGNGWIQDLAFNVPAPAVVVNTNGESAYIGTWVDLDNDGQLDFARNYEQASQRTEQYWLYDVINKTWNATTDYSFPYPETRIDANGETLSVAQSLDINSDGWPEVFMRDAAGSISTSRPVGFPVTAYPGALTMVVSSLGQVSKVEYAHSTDSSVYELAGLTPYPNIANNAAGFLVKRVQLSDGIGGYNTATHTYRQSRRNALVGGLGFESHTLTNVDTGVSVHTEYIQHHSEHGLQLAGRVAESTKEYLPTPASNTPVLLSRSESDYAVANVSINGLQTLLPFVTQSRVMSYDADNSGQLLMTEVNTTELADVNPYGNVAKTTREVLNAQGEVQLRAINEVLDFENRLSDWILGLPKHKRQTLESADASERYVGETTVTFDAVSRPATETIEPGNASSVIKSFDYDVFGNRIRETIRARVNAASEATAQYQDRFSEVEFSADGRFPIVVRNALGHEATTQYDALLGKPEWAQDANGLRKEFVYDGFGTVIKETKAHESNGATRGREIVMPEFCDDPQYSVSCPDNAVYFIAAFDDIGEAPEIAYYNLNGKELMRKTFGFDGSSVVVETEYDAQGRKISVTRPYFSDQGLPANGTGKTSYEYDVLGREISRVNAAGDTFVTQYSGFSVTTTNPGNNDSGAQNKVVTNDLFGRPVHMIDADGLVTEYQYDLRGNLLTTRQLPTDVPETSEVVTYMNYDPVFGRKVSMDDPDLGVWSYEYNGFGELVRQTDAKGQITRNQYDILGRLSQRTDDEQSANPIVTQWSFYDDPAETLDSPRVNETVILGALKSVSSPEFYREVRYDQYARPVRTLTTIKGQSYEQRSGYKGTTERLDWLQYPSGLTIRQSFDDYGFPQTVEGADLNDEKYIEYQTAAQELLAKQRELQAWEESLAYEDWLHLEALKADFARLGQLVDGFYDELEEGADYEAKQDEISRIQSLLDNIEIKVTQHDNWQTIYSDQIKAIQETHKADFDYIKLQNNKGKPHFVTYENLRPQYDVLYEQAEPFQSAISNQQQLIISDVGIVLSHARDIEALAATLPAGPARDSVNQAADNAESASLINNAISNVESTLHQTPQTSPHFDTLWSIYSHLFEIRDWLNRIAARQALIDGWEADLAPIAAQLDSIGAQMNDALNRYQYFQNLIGPVVERLKPHTDKINKWLDPITQSHTNVLLAFNNRTIGELNKIFAINGSLIGRRALHPDKFLAQFDKHLDYLNCIEALPTPSDQPRATGNCYKTHLITLDDVVDIDMPMTQQQLQAKLAERRAEIAFDTTVDVMRAWETKEFYCSRQTGYDCPAEFNASIDRILHSIDCAQMPAVSRRTNDDSETYWHCPNSGATLLVSRHNIPSYQQAALIDNVAGFRASLHAQHAAKVETAVCAATQGTRQDECDKTADEIWLDALEFAQLTENLEDSVAYVTDPDQYVLIATGEVQAMADTNRAEALSSSTENALQGMLTLTPEEIALITNFAQIESLLLSYEGLVEQEYQSLGDTGQYLAIQSLLEDVQRLEGRVDLLNSEYRNEEKTVYWEAEDINAAGQITRARYGNDTETQWTYDVFGRIDSVLVAATSDNANNPGNTLVNNSFSYDALGNLIFREDHVVNLREDFSYDSMNRLRWSTVSGNASALAQQLGIQTTEYRYDQLGNMRFKSDLAGGVYEYGSVAANAGPHAVSTIHGLGDFQYDANGNQIVGNGRTVEYASFNKPTRIVKDGITTDMLYGAERELVWKADNENGYRQTFYVGGLYEEDHQAGQGIVQRHSIAVAGEVIALVEQTVGQQGAKESYLHKNHQGSIVAISDEQGIVAERRYYDAFGKQRRTLGEIGAQLVDWQSSFVTNLGFTGHLEMVSAGIIHMGGRVYDPEVGRFLSADPHIQSPLSSQSYNRYSYTLNNPLSLTDPSGYFFRSLFKALKKLFRKLNRIIRKVVRVVLDAVFGVLNWINRNIKSIVMVALQFVPVVGQYISYALVAYQAAYTLKHGGSLADVLKAAVVSYVLNQAGGIFKSIRGAAVAVGEFIGNAVGTAVNVVSKAGNFIATAVAQGIASSINAGITAKLLGGSFSKTFKESIGASLASAALDHQLGQNQAVIDPELDRLNREADDFVDWVGQNWEQEGTSELLAVNDTQPTRSIFDNPGRYLPTIDSRVVDFVAGFGDLASFGLSEYIREINGIDGGVDYTSDSYTYGLYAGVPGTLGTIAAGGTAFNIGLRAIKGGKFYHYTSVENALKIGQTSTINASTGSTAFYGRGVYVSAFRNPNYARVQGAASTEVMITIYGRPIATPFPGTFRFGSGVRFIKR